VGPFVLLHRAATEREVLHLAFNLFCICTRLLFRRLLASSSSSSSEPVARNFATNFRTTDFLGSLTPGYFCIKATQHSTKDLCFMYSSYMNILCSSVYLILNTKAKNKHSTWFPINYKTITLRIWTLSLKQCALHHSDMTLRCRQCMRHSTIHRWSAVIPTSAPSTMLWRRKSQYTIYCIYSYWRAHSIRLTMCSYGCIFCAEPPCSLTRVTNVQRKVAPPSSGLLQQ
jgi:hypothetical protein